MNLVVIYGPPAVGKYTVAKELQKITNYKLLHNHLTVDLISSILDFGTSNFFKLSSQFRIQLIEAAVLDKVHGMIFTFCYVPNEDDKFIKSLFRLTQKYNINLYFVQLTCSEPELYHRVRYPSRMNFLKLKTKKSLHNSLRKWHFFSQIPSSATLSIDNTELGPKKAAHAIKKHYKL